MRVGVQPSSSSVTGEKSGGPIRRVTVSAVAFVIDSEILPVCSSVPPVRVAAPKEPLVRVSVVARLLPAVPAVDAVNETVPELPAAEATALESPLMAERRAVAALAAEAFAPEPRVAAAKMFVPAVNVSVVAMLLPPVPPTRAVIVQLLLEKVAAEARELAVLTPSVPLTAATKLT